MFILLQIELSYSTMNMELEYVEWSLPDLSQISINMPRRRHTITHSTSLDRISRCLQRCNYIKSKLGSAVCLREKQVNQAKAARLTELFISAKPCHNLIILSLGEPFRRMKSKEETGSSQPQGQVRRCDTCRANWQQIKAVGCTRHAGSCMSIIVFVLLLLLQTYTASPL